MKLDNILLRITLERLFHGLLKSALITKLQDVQSGAE